MNRFIPLTAICVLLLVGAARADEEIERMEVAVQEAATQVEQLLAKADETEDPNAKKAILQEVEYARARWNDLKAQLAATCVKRAAEREASARKRTEAKQLYDEARMHYERLKASHGELEKMKARLEQAKGSAEEIRRVQQSLENARAALGLIKDAKQSAIMERLEYARKTLAEALKRVRQDGTHVRTITSDHAGRVVLEGVKPGRHRIHFFRGRSPEAAETRARIEHLRQAAHHLREAGAPEAAEKIEREIRGLEERLERAERPHPPESPEAVFEAIQDLRREVRELREEIRELRELLTQAHRR